MEAYMESELSGIFRVKLVTKNIERGSSGTQFMHMRVKKETEKIVLLQVKDLIHIIVKFTTKKNSIFLSSPPVILLSGAPLNIVIGHEVLCSNKGTD